ncbi:MAG: SDR family oxidoreductase [Rhodospirillales bacterium]
MNHEGKRVIISAAADGIGKLTAEAYLAEGARVAICDIDPDKVAAFAAAQPNLVAEVCDVGQEAAVAAWMDRALAALGGCDTLINNAGISGPTATIEEVAIEDLRSCLEIGLVSHFVCTAKVMPGMKAQGSGLIVNISSAAGLHAYPLRTVYAATKWAVVGVSKSLASEVGPQGIRVNAICPGAIAGDRIDRVIAARAEAQGITFDEMKAELSAKASLRTLIPPEDITAMTLYLDSPGGARISGQALAVDGHLVALA